MASLVEAVSLFGGAVAVAIDLAATFCALAFDGEGDLEASVSLFHSLGRKSLVLQVVETIAEPVSVIACSGVVVGRCTEGIEFRSVAFFDDGLAAVGQCGE